MKLLYSTFVLLSVCTALLMAQSPVRTKRGLLELAGIIKCSTGRSATSYWMYGCYCGLGGKGSPIDGTDQCCFNHDLCYTQAKNEHCRPKISKYKWTCEDKEAECDPLSNRCQQMICECDREIGQCFKQAIYNKSLDHWPNFRCKN